MTTLAEIAHAVCVHWKISESELFHRTRGLKHVARARMALYWLGKDITGKTAPQIGRFTKRDHSTVLHGCRVVDALIVEDADFQQDIMTIKRGLA